MSDSLEPPVIVHLIYRFDVGGLEKVMIDTINSLTDYEHVVVALTEANKKSCDMLERPSKIYELHKKPGKDLSIWKKLFALFLQLKPRILHSYNLATLEYQLLAFMMRVPLRIHAEHGRDASDPEGINPKYRYLRKLVSPFIHNWVPVSHDLSIWLADFIAVPKAKIKLIYNGIDTDFFEPSSHRDRQVFEGFALEHDIVVGTIGRLDPVKNQSIMIDAYQLVCEKKPSLKDSLKFAIIGSGPLADDLDTRIINAGLQDQIWLPGARYQIRELLDAMDIFILPSIAEGIPMTLLEAMSMEKPVIASNVGGIPEILDDDNGIMVAPRNASQLADAILFVIENHEKSIIMRNCARQKIIGKFSLRKMIDQYSSLYSPC
jgi:sugar transferase (PEP-CTERM/EpsH1 system associated)